MLLSPAPELGWRRSDDICEVIWGSLRRASAGFGEEEREGGREARM